MSEGGSILDQFRIDYNHLILGSVLGEGSFGTVHMGTMTRGSGASQQINLSNSFSGGDSSTLVVAIKTVRSTKVTQSMVRAFMREIIISKCGIPRVYIHLKSLDRNRVLCFAHTHV